MGSLGLDATYALDPEPTGVAVYSRALIGGLAGTESDLALYYRWHRFRKLDRSRMPAAVRHRLLLDPLSPSVEIFHGLNQRLPRRIRKHAVATFHDLFVMTAEYSEPAFRERFTRFARDAAERADAVIAVSRFTGDQVEALLGVERARIHVIPHGVDSAPRSARSERLVLHVGAIQKRKNLVHLVEAFEGMPAGWRLALVGGNGYGAEEVHQRIASSPRKADILTPGFVRPETLEAWYQRAAIFAFPSWDEGFGLPVLEAMARGIPVVTAAASATQEVAGDAAVLVDPSRPEELAEALRGIAKDPGSQQESVERGLVRASAFSWDRAVSATRAVYRSLRKV